MWYRDMIQEAAEFHDLDWKLVEALVRVESSGNADAFRFEPKFWSRYLAKKDEWKGCNPRRVSSSYGLMQIMYVTATERGYTGEPEELFIPEVNLHWGCTHLKYLIQWAREFKDVTPARQMEAAVASWNGGRGGNKPTDTLLRSGQYVKKVGIAYQAIERNS
jgi:hypothetical protein